MRAKLKSLNSIVVALAMGLVTQLLAGLAHAQNEEDWVSIIISARDASSCRSASRRFRGFEKRVELMRSHMKGRILALTGCEVWSLPRGEIAPFQKSVTDRDIDVTVLQGNWLQVFREVGADANLSQMQKSLVDAIASARTSKALRIMNGPPAAVLEYALTRNDTDDKKQSPARISVVLADGSVRSVERTSLSIDSNKVVWRGRVEQTGGSVTLMWWPTGKMAGTIRSADRTYSIRHLGGAHYAVVEIDSAKMPDEHAPMSERLRRANPTLRDDPLVREGDASRLLLSFNSPGASRLSIEQRKRETLGSSPPTPATIDLMVAYTRKVRSHYLDVRREFIELAVEEANNSFRLSKISNVKLRLVRTYETNYVERGEHFDHLYRMVDKGDGDLEDIPTERAKAKADVVVLIVDDPKGCGLATRVYADACEAYAVVHYECAVENYSLAHEIGHLIGARHELAIDPLMDPFPYGHGYVNGTKWRDIMSSKQSCSGCERIPIWSSPTLLVNGEPAGTSLSDNSRVIATQSARIAAFDNQCGKNGPAAPPKSPDVPAADR